jgi:GAF domain-containing protein
MATSNGQPRIAQDISQYTGHYKNPLLPETHSQLIVPLKVDDRVIGALDVQSQFVNAFTEDDITTLQIIADQLAVAIQSAQLLEEVQLSLLELENIYNQYSSEEWSKLHQSKSILGYQYDNSYLTPLTTESEKVDPGVDSGSHTVEVPLLVRGVTIGELGVEFEGDYISPNDIRLIESISTRLSQAMESARLFEETQRRAAREQIASEITNKLHASNNPQTILQTAVLELHKALKVNRAQVIIQKNVPKPGNGNQRGNGHNLAVNDEKSE